MSRGTLFRADQIQIFLSCAPCKCCDGTYAPWDPVTRQDVIDHKVSTFARIQRRTAPALTGRGVYWVCFDRSNWGYLWLFSTREIAASHRKKQHSKQLNARLTEPEKFGTSHYWRS